MLGTVTVKGAIWEHDGRGFSAFRDQLYSISNSHLDPSGLCFTEAQTVLQVKMFLL